MRVLLQTLLILPLLSFIPYTGDGNGAAVAANEEDNLQDPFHPPPDYSSNAMSFEELPPLERWEREEIATLVTDMADKNVFQLLIDKREMEKRGERINHIHPLRFISFVIGEQKLRKALKLVRKSMFKWDSFVEGFARRLKEEGMRGNLLRHIPGFTAYLHVDEVPVAEIVRRGDWEGLMNFLIDNA